MFKWQCQAAPLRCTPDPVVAWHEQSTEMCARSASYKPLQSIFSCQTAERAGIVDPRLWGIVSSSLFSNPT